MRRIISHVYRAVRGVTVRGIRMRERAYNFSVSFRVGRGTHRIVLTIIYTVSNPQKKNMHMIRSVKFHACGPNPRDTKNALTLSRHKVRNCKAGCRGTSTSKLCKLHAITDLICTS
jgi:hypothetical protein